MPIRTYVDFSGGVNTKQVAPIIIDRGVEALKFSGDSVNWEQSENGLIKAFGNDGVLSSALGGSPTITGVFEYNGTTQEQIMCAGTNIYTVVGGTPTSVKGSQTADKFYTSLETDDNGGGTPVLLLMNGTDSLVYYDGTTCAAASITDPDTIWSTFKPKFAESFRGRIFYSDGSQIITPVPGTYNDFTVSGGADAFMVASGFGGAITGLQALTDDIMLIFKERAVFRLSGSEAFGGTTDPFSISTVSNEFGCVATRTIVQVGLEVYFLSQAGIRKLTPVQSYGDIDPTQPTYPIQDEVNEWNWSKTAIENACAVFLKKDNHVYFSVPFGTSTTNNKVYTIDAITGGVDPRALGDILASCFGVYSRELYSGGYAGQFFDYIGVNSYDGAAITATWESKWIAHDGLSTLKDYDYIDVYTEADAAGDLVVQSQVLRRGDTDIQSSTLEIAGDGGLWDTGLWDAMLWAGDASGIYRIDNPGKGNALKLKFTNTSDTQRIKIRAVEVVYKVLSHAKG